MHGSFSGINSYTHFCISKEITLRIVKYVIFCKIFKFQKHVLVRLNNNSSLLLTDIKSISSYFSIISFEFIKFL